MTSETRADLVAQLADYSLVVTFQPTPQPNVKYHELKLHYNVQLTHRDRVLYNGPYTMGVWHLEKAYNTRQRQDLNMDTRRYGGVTRGMDAVARTIAETGRTGNACIDGHCVNSWAAFRLLKAPEPQLTDVLYSVLSDADAIDYPTYEEWAGSCGYEEDSRQGERIYRLCLSIGLKLRNTLGDAELTRLRDLFQDY